MKKIDSYPKPIRQLLAKKHSLDFYQREYSWQKKHVIQLINDLASIFLDHYKVGDKRSDVGNYGYYYLGSIIISDRSNQRYIIDGQQRLTTLTLLLIKLYRLLEDEDQKSQIAPLILAVSFGKKSFNLDIPERQLVMEALYEDTLFDPSNQPESVRNTAARYNDIEDNLLEELQGEALPYFVDWLIEKVYLVEIIAYTDSDAYIIFETMNDRGLSLTPTDMLKGYLLASITDTEERNIASKVWLKHIQKLTNIGKDEPAEAIKSWLRSQYALSIREHRRGSERGDFELIGTEFHRWVRDEKEHFGTETIGISGFIKHEFDFYAHWYHRLQTASESMQPGLECVYYNANHNFTLQYPALLAPLHVNDTDEEEILRKIQITARYLDILIHRRIWNGRSTDYSNIFHPICRLILEIRRKSSSELVKLLYPSLNEGNDTFFSSGPQLSLFHGSHTDLRLSAFTRNNQFHLHGRNRSKIHLILARMMEYVEIESGESSRYVEYVEKENTPYEVEHIWANHPERHVDEFPNEADFEEYRNRIGGLLLLPKSINASIGDEIYTKKLGIYSGQSLLAKSLHEQAYKNNPGFRHFIERSGLPFRPHAEFKKADLDARQKLYQLLAEQIWNPERLREDTS